MSSKGNQGSGTGISSVAFTASIGPRYCRGSLDVAGIDVGSPAAGPLSTTIRCRMAVPAPTYFPNGHKNVPWGCSERRYVVKEPVAVTDEQPAGSSVAGESLSLGLG